MQFISLLLAASLTSACTNQSATFYASQNGVLTNSEFCDSSGNTSYIEGLIENGNIQSCASVTVLTHGIGGAFGDFLINNNKRGEYLNGTCSSIAALTDSYSIHPGSIINRLQQNNYRYDTLTGNQLQPTSNMYVFGDVFSNGNGSIRKLISEDNNNIYTLSNSIESHTDIDINTNIILMYNGALCDADLVEGDYFQQFKDCLNSALSMIARQQDNTLPKINLIGHSKGGIANIKYATEYPELVQTIFTLGSPLGKLTYINELFSISDVVERVDVARYSDILDITEQFINMSSFNSVCDSFYSRAFSFSQTTTHLKNSLLDAITRAVNLGGNTDILTRIINFFFANFESIIDDIGKNNAHQIIRATGYLANKLFSDDVLQYTNPILAIIDYLIDDYVSYSSFARESIFRFDTLVNQSSSDGFLLGNAGYCYNFNDTYECIVGSNIKGDPFSVDLISEYNQPIIAHNLEAKSTMAAAIIMGDLQDHNGLHDHQFTNEYNSTNHFKTCLCGAKAERNDHNLSITPSSSTNHTISCIDCAFATSEEHTFEYTCNETSSFHQQRCIVCNATYMNPHSKTVFVPFSATKHQAYCVCGKSYSLESHTYSSGSLTCTKCGQVNGISKPIVFPSIGD